ncbi:hypothetical protein CLU79DRAFT_715466 [Phycomyces nitens]|nr:hypothetical protein CLU79DRAFT_715466 [Phycomyces nitens]
MLASLKNVPKNALTKVNPSKISDTLQGSISSNGNEERVVLAAPIKYWSEEMTLKGNKRSFITFEKFQLEHDNIEKTMMNSYTEEDLLFKSSPPFLEKTICYNGEVDIGYLFQVFDEIGYVAGTKHLDNFPDPHRESSYVPTASAVHLHLLLPATVQDIRCRSSCKSRGDILWRWEFEAKPAVKKRDFMKKSRYVYKKDIPDSANNESKKSEIFKAFGSDSFYNQKGELLEGYKSINDTTLQSTLLIPPQTLKYAYDIAYITARTFVGSSVRMHSLDEANFHSKVEIGSIMRLTAQVIYSSQDTNMFQVKVVSRVSDSNGSFDAKFRCEIKYKYTNQ